MALDSTKVRVAVTGALYVDQTGQAAIPTGTSSVLGTTYKDQGYVSEDGVTLSMPDAGDVTSLKAWQGSAVVRTIRQPSEDNPTIQLTLVETKLETIQTTFGVTVIQTSTEGQFDVDTTKIRTPLRGVLDVIDGAELTRAAIPRAFVTSVGEIAFTSTDATGYQVTLEMERDPVLGFNFRSWMTALKSTT